jgi:hypothetical protein
MHGWSFSEKQVAFKSHNCGHCVCVRIMIYKRRSKSEAELYSERDLNSWQRPGVMCLCQNAQKPLTEVGY